MIRRNSRTLQKLKTRCFTVDILGGEDDYEEYIYSFMHAEQGIKPLYELYERKLNVPATDFIDIFYSEEGENVFFLLNTGHVNYGLLNTGEYGTVFQLQTSPNNRKHFFHVSVQDKKNGRIELFICNDSLAYLRGGIEGTITRIQIPYNIRSGIIHCGRLFAVDIYKPYRLLWSGINVLDWSSSVEGYGYIDLDMNGGDIVQIAELDDNLICLRERGITVVHALADSRNYRLSPDQQLLGGINATGKGAVFNGKFYFPCIDGIYSFDGNQITKEFALSMFETCIYSKIYVGNGGVLFVECNNGEKDFFLVYEIAEKRWGIFGLTCKFPFWANGNLYCYNTQIGGIGSVTLNHYATASVWKSKAVSFGTKPVKTLKSLYIDASADVTIDVIADSATYTYNGRGRIPVGLKGDTFKFEIRKTRAEIRKVTCFFEEAQ
ncbi:MAG: hypothetical protein ACI4MS_02305 [Candidatus Coproplasma sp.]